MGKFFFKKDARYDLALLSETDSLNPYSLALSKASPLWNEVAENLRKSNLQLDVTGRSCRERVTQLLKEFKKSEALSIKSSGISEADMSQIKHLLTSIASRESKRPKATTGKEQILRKKLEAQEIRKTAETAAKEQIENLDSSDLSDIDDAGMLTTQKTMDKSEPPPKKKRNQPADGLVTYLKDKAENEKLLRLEELRVRSAEAQNKNLELQIMKEKQELDCEERKKTTDLLSKLIDQLAKK